MIKVNSHNTLRKHPNLLILSKFFPFFFSFVIVLCLTWQGVSWSAKPPHVEVVALFENKAMLLIDKQQLLVSVGETTEQGVTLVEADAKSAVIEYDGKRRRVVLGGLVRPQPGQGSAQEAKIYVYRGTDNLFRTTGSINGYPVNFLVDTGASSIALSSREAKRLGISYRLTGKPTWISTASGTESGYRVIIDRVTIAGITLHSIEGLVLEGNEPANPLLGMSYLNRFEITNSGQIMTLKRKY